MLLTIQHHSHFGLEVVVGELPEGKGFPGCVLENTEGNADGVLWRKTYWMDEPARREGNLEEAAGQRGGCALRRFMHVFAK